MGADFKVIPDQFHLLTLHINVEAQQNGCYSADDIRSVGVFFAHTAHFRRMKYGQKVNPELNDSKVIKQQP